MDDETLKSGYVTIPFKSEVTEFEAVDAVEDFLSKPMDKKYWTEHIGPSKSMFYDCSTWKLYFYDASGKKRWDERMKKLNPPQKVIYRGSACTYVFLEGYSIKKGHMSLGCGN